MPLSKRRHQARQMRTTAAAIVFLTVAGCFTAPRAPRDIADRDPSVKIPAIKAHAGQRNKGVVAQLVADLDNDDPAVRFYAITALRNITGQTFDYRYYDDEFQRRDALAKWQSWLEEQSRSATSPATRPGI